MLLTIIGAATVAAWLTRLVVSFDRGAAYDRL